MISNNAKEPRNLRSDECEQQDKSYGGTRVVSFFKAYVSGSASSAATTILFQPLELLKTRMQILSDKNVTESSDFLSKNATKSFSSRSIFGRSTRSLLHLIKQHNLLYLWRGTGASLLRSVPGVGLYYSSLNLINSLYSEQHQKNPNSMLTFSSGFLARSSVSVILLPLTVIKVRYESGTYPYKSIFSAAKDSYLKSGWVGLQPTIIRDSLFSGIYYMLYSELKQHFITQKSTEDCYKNSSIMYFISGLLSGSVASLITNPADVVKTNMQIDPGRHRTMAETARNIYIERNGLIGFFDGLCPRMLRRTLVAAFTWTLYEYMIVMIGS